MSDTIKGLTVTLRDGMRDDDAEHVINAIKMIVGVIAVDAHIEGVDHVMAMNQAKRQMQAKFQKVMDEIYS